jgi:Integral membrane protein CcmA involved in cell shape determination
MKFFDPKKKETTVPPERTVNPAPQPFVPPAPPASSPTHSVNPVPPVNINPATVLPPVVNTPPAPEKTVVKEVPVQSRPALVTEKMTPQVNFQTVIGSSLMIKGDVMSEEDILVHGFVEGNIETSGDVIVGPEGKVFANIKASNVTISGKVIGNVTASGKVNLSPAGLLQGNIRAPKLSIAESALFRGAIDMRPQEHPSSSEREERPHKSVTSAQLESIQK